MKRLLLLLAVGTIVMSGARVAMADPTRGPFQVMSPDGSVVRISSDAAEVWWMDYRGSMCVSCRGPRQASALLTAVENGLGGRLDGGPRYLILVEALRSSWPRAWVFYPSSDEMPAYVMKPGGVGSGAAPLRWDAWHRATSRMEEIILDATGATSPPTIEGEVEEFGANGPAPVAWIAASVVLVALLAGVGAARRRSRPSPKGRRRAPAANFSDPHRR